MTNKSHDYIEADVPMKIYVGGLTEHLADISEQDLRTIFNFGDIDFIDVNKDPMTGKTRGYAFIQFRKSSQAKAAIAAMNGFNYKGKILKVGEASSGIKNGNELFLPSGEFEDSSYLHNLQSRQTLSQKLSKDNVPYSAPIGGSACKIF
jgi:RNA recognition motif-containing protein